MVSFQKIHYAFKCVEKGIAKKKYEKHLVEYGQWAAFKLQIKLLRGLTKQFGRCSFEKRIHKRTQFALSYCAAGRRDIDLNQALFVAQEFTAPVVNTIMLKVRFDEKLVEFYK